MTAQKIIADIIRREGGYVNHPGDKGGATKYGITKKTLESWRNQTLFDVEVERLTIAEATEIYEANYLKKPKIDWITDEKLKALVLDTAVNSGPLTAIKLLQQSVGAQADGVLGPVTIGIIQSFDDSQEVRKRFLAARIAFLGKLIINNPSQSVFAAGWASRMSELLIEYI